MTPKQLKALVELMRSPAGPAQDAARMVLCDKMRQADAARATGITPASVSNAVARARATFKLACDAAGV